MSFRLHRGWMVFGLIAGCCFGLAGPAAADGSSNKEIEAERRAFRKAAVERIRRKKPAKTPDWVNRIPDRIVDILAEKHLYKDGEVWGLARRNPYKGLPYDEGGSVMFYNYVKQHNLWDRFPKLDDAAREKTLRFWQSWQDPKTGLFKDPRYPERMVNEKYVIGLIEKLGGKPLYPMSQTSQMAAKDSKGKIDTTVFLRRSKSDPDWERGGWGVGSHTGFMAVELFRAINEGQTELIPDLEQGMENILSHQDPESGLWGPPSASLKGRIGGTLKVVLRFYFGMGLKEPYTRQLADSLIEHERNGDWYRAGTDFCVPQNVIIMVVYCLEVSDYRREDLLGVLESKVKEYQQWVNPDGSLLIRRGDRNSLGIEFVHIAALGMIGGYLHWEDCRLPNPFQDRPYHRGGIGFRYRPVLQEDGTVKVVDAAKPKITEPKIVEMHELGKVWAGHPVRFCLLTHANRQYVAYYDAQRRMTVASRNLDGKNWTVQVLPSSLVWDSHNHVTMALDHDGHLHVSGNMHVGPLVYFRSDKPYDVTTLKPVHRMTGKEEKRVTYPRFLHNTEGRLLFMYRDGESGKGRRLLNIHDETTGSWRRFLDVPMLDGLGRVNAYPSDLVRGPDGWFHLAWMWRDTMDCRTNHDISYARSRDLKHWEGAGGKPVTLPITPDSEDVVIDPVPSGKGLINGDFGVGFDTANRAVIHYHKYDANGNSQIYLARWEGGQWEIRPVSSWEYTWRFGGGGAIRREIAGSPVKVLPDGRLVQPWWHVKYGKGTWQLDPKTLKVIGTINPPPKYPEALRQPESDFEGMQVHWCDSKGSSGQPNVKYCLRWETLPPNRDQPRKGPLPEPGMLRLYKLLLRE